MKTADLGFANLDLIRKQRTGAPEAVFCQGKTSKQVGEIIKVLAEGEGNIFGTRATPEDFAETKKLVPEAKYYEEARIIAVEKQKESERDGVIAVVTAGTADIPVAEEAAVVAELLGNPVNRIYDVGVAGIHRLFERLEEIREARVIIAVAGMEGALPSVLGGLVESPVIAVPTGVGYGAHFEGMAALLAMLNSCAPGVGVVNIDNGYGAACLASKINR